MLEFIELLINYIGKRLPAFIKTPIVSIYSKWDSYVIIDKKLVKDLMEYFNLSYDEILALLTIGPEPAIEYWNKLKPKTENEIMAYYKNIPYNIFNLAYWHMSRRQRRFRKKVVRYSFGDVLDYGGGIGDLSVKFASKGLNVTYADVMGENMKFAKYLFLKSGYDIKVLDVEKDQEKLWKQKYDSIIAIDVIEHILSPDAVLKNMARHLKPNGRLIITNLEYQGGIENEPMHFKINFNAEKLLNSFGLFKSKVYDWLWTYIKI